MFVLEDPYVSDLMRDTIEENGYCVLMNKKSAEQEFSAKVNLCDDEKMIQAFKNKRLIYSNSENSIEWMGKNLAFSDIVKQIDVFKNKILFRESLKKTYPHFYYKEISLKQLDEFDISSIKMPFIIKPKYGFLSIGVFTVSTPQEWKQVVTEIKKSTQSFGAVFPKEVISPESFIIEEFIPGTEYAIDAYYNNAGEPVVINILEHVFSSASHVSDRLYITSKKIIEKTLEGITDFLKKTGNELKIKNFPIHLEVRVDGDKMVPIEINPMRFAGWCTTDIVHFAFGINPYEYFMEQKKPDWPDILANKAGKIFSIVVLDKPKEINNKNLLGFDYDKLTSGFEKVLECRKINYKQYPLFGFLFTETKENNYLELNKILVNDLKEFIIYEG